MTPSLWFSIFVLFLRNNVQRSRSCLLEFLRDFFFTTPMIVAIVCARLSSFGRLLTLAFYSRQRFAITGRKKRRKKRRADEPSEPWPKCENRRAKSPLFSNSGWYNETLPRNAAAPVTRCEGRHVESSRKATESRLSCWRAHSRVSIEEERRQCVVPTISYPI